MSCRKKDNDRLKWSEVECCGVKGARELGPGTSGNLHRAKL